MTADPGPGWWDCNAHVRRARASGRWDSFWVFKGAAEKTRAFAKALRFARDEAESVFGRGWQWRASPTALQTNCPRTRGLTPRRRSPEGKSPHNLPSASSGPFTAASRRPFDQL